MNNLFYFCNAITNEITNKIFIAMKKMKLREFWASRDKASSTKILTDLAEICGKSIQTIQAWMLDYRKPDKLETAAVVSYLKENYQVEIVED